MTSKAIHHGTKSIAPLRRVVVTGMGAISPLGNSMESSWNHLFHNTSPNTDIGIITLEQAIYEQNLPSNILQQELDLIGNLPCQVAAPVRNIEYDARTSRFIQFALHAGMEATRDANLNQWLELNDDKKDNVNLSSEIQYRRERTGVSLGIGLSSIRDITISSQTKLNRLSPHFVPKILPNSAPSRLSIALSLQGPNHAISTACAASSHAIIDGIRCIQMSDADIMYVGGFESCIDPLSIAGFCRLRALSTQYKYSPESSNHILDDMDIKSSSRPFDSKRDGFVMGEGGAILILEELEHAKKRIKETGKGKILCEVIGYGTAGDAYHMTAPETNGKGAERAIQMAIDRASSFQTFTNDDQNIRDAIQYVNAHATSTPLGDDIEAKVLNKIFMSSSSTARHHDLYVSSTKGATGHLLGAAGALEAAYTVMTLCDGKIPPTQNLVLHSNAESNTQNTSNPLNNHSFKHVTEDMGIIRQDIQFAISNSLGFGGTNASLIFAKYQDT